MFTFFQLYDCDVQVMSKRQSDFLEKCDNLMKIIQNDIKVILQLSFEGLICQGRIKSESNSCCCVVAFENDFEVKFVSKDVYDKTSLLKISISDEKRSEIRKIIFGNLDNFVNLFASAMKQKERNYQDLKEINFLFKRYIQELSFLYFYYGQSLNFDLSDSVNNILDEKEEYHKAREVYKSKNNLRTYLLIGTSPIWSMFYCISQPFIACYMCSKFIEHSDDNEFERGYWNNPLIYSITA